MPEKGLVQIVPKSIVGGAALNYLSNISILPNGRITFTQYYGFTVNNVFSSTYENYMINVYFDGATQSGSNTYITLSSNGASTVDTTYTHQELLITSVGSTQSQTTSFWRIGGVGTQYRNSGNIILIGPYRSNHTGMHSMFSSTVSGGTPAGPSSFYMYTGTHAQEVSYDGFSLSGNFSISGTIDIFGFNK